MSDYDVLVLGSGISGLSAALEAADAGASVLLAEAEDEVGGRTRYSTGMIMAAGTRFQRERGIEDSPEKLFMHYMALNQWKLDPGPVRRLTEEVGPAVEWMADKGLEILDLYFSGDEDVPRGHVTRGGQAIVDVAYADVRSRSNIDVALGRRVDRLLTDPDGRVVGAAVGDDEVNAGAVVLATGGFVGNRELLEKYLPDIVNHAGDWIFPVGGEVVGQISQGDGLLLAQQVGAQLVGRNRGLCTFRPNFSEESDAYLPGWLVVVNGQGRRFFDEMSPYSVTEPIVRAQPGPVFALFDEAAKRASQPKSTFDFKKVHIPGQTWEDWVEPVIDEMVEQGKVHKADSIDKLAGLMGVPSENLRGTVDVYNESVDRGEDELYRKRADVLRAISTPPFYATEMRLRSLTMTSFGPRIRHDGAVLAEDSRVIPGLYAGGECTGGVLGDVYIGSGNALGNCFAMGRVAGRYAARYATEIAPETASAPTSR